MKSPFDVFADPIRLNSDIPKLSQLTHFEEGQTIITADERDDQVYFVLRGSVKVTNFSLDGKEIWHGVLGPGKTFGELAAFGNAPRNATVSAVSELDVGIVSKADLMAIMERDVHVAFWFMRELSERITISTEKIRSLLTQSVAQRVHGELLQLARSVRGQPGRFVIEPTPNLTEIARRINSNRENVSREVSSLIKQETLARSEKGLVVLNMDFLKRSAAY